MKIRVLLTRANRCFGALSFHKDPRDGSPLPADAPELRPELQALWRALSGYAAVFQRGLDRRSPGSVRDMDKLRRHRDMAADLLRGVDPTTGEILSADDPLVRPYCHEILEGMVSLLDLALATGRYRAPRDPFALPRTRWAEVPVTAAPCTTGQFCSRVNDLLDDGTQARLRPRDLNGWLVRKGALSVPQAAGSARSTAMGQALGITSQDRTDPDGHPYVVQLCSIRAQRYLVRHLDEIAQFLAEAA